MLPSGYDMQVMCNTKLIFNLFKLIIIYTCILKISAFTISIINI